MQVVIWIVIILLAIFLIWLLRRWIKRIIFILILLGLAFLIYGIFNPSGASRLWYNVRTFPQRVMSWVSSSSQFLDYDNYKLEISSIGDGIGDKIGLEDDVEKIDLAENSDNAEILCKEKEDIVENETINTEDSKIIQPFPDSIQFVDMPVVNEGNKQEEKSGDAGALTGYSKSDLFGVIDDYLEKNLDDDTDILVTVEYEDVGKDPQKIILQTQPKK